MKEQIKTAAIEKAKAFYAGNETALMDLQSVLSSLDDRFWLRFPESAGDKLIDVVSDERKARIRREIEARRSR